MSLSSEAANQSDIVQTEGLGGGGGDAGLKCQRFIRFKRELFKFTVRWCLGKTNSFVSHLLLVQNQPDV